MGSQDTKPGPFQNRDAQTILQVLFEISEAISATRNLETLYPFVQEALGKIFDFHEVYLILCHQQNPKILIPYALGAESPLEKSKDIDEALALSRKVISQKKPVQCSEKQNDKDLPPKEKEKAKPVLKTWIGAPLLIDHRVIGVLVLSSTEESRAFKKQDIHLLKMIALHVAVAIDRRESEELFLQQSEILRRILESSPVGIALVQNREFKWVNRKMVSMFGYSDKSELENKNARMIYCSQQDYERAGKMIFYGITSVGSADYEINLVKKDKTRFPAHIRLNCADQADPMEWTIATVSDISQRRAGEKNKVEKEKLKGVLAIAESVSHEIDNPLKSIFEYFKRFEKKHTPAQEDVQNLRLQALAIGKITKRLTDITRYDMSDRNSPPRMKDIWNTKKDKE